MFNHFIRALHTFGPSDVERAQTLGITLRSFYRYKAGQLPAFATFLMRHPTLAQAVLDDAQTYFLMQHPIFAQAMLDDAETSSEQPDDAQTSSEQPDADPCLQPVEAAHES